MRTCVSVLLKCVCAAFAFACEVHTCTTVKVFYLHTCLSLPEISTEIIFAHVTAVSGALQLLGTAL
jgi:hypothetical protein